MTVQVLGSQSLSPQTSSVSVIGDSYGTMGTDSAGRPIDLGVLAGLPWALEIGALSSVIVGRGWDPVGRARGVLRADGGTR